MTFNLTHIGRGFETLCPSKAFLDNSFQISFDKSLKFNLKLITQI